MFSRLSLPRESQETQGDRSLYVKFPVSPSLFITQVKKKAQKLSCRWYLPTPNFSFSRRFLHPPYFFGPFLLPPVLFLSLLHVAQLNRATEGYHFHKSSSYWARSFQVVCLKIFIHWFWKLFLCCNLLGWSSLISNFLGKIYQHVILFPLVTRLSGDTSWSMYNRWTEVGSI